MIANENRFLSEELGILIAEYIGIVRPMEIYLSEIFNTKGKQDLKEFLWADYRKGIWNGAFLSDLLKQYTSKHGMHALGFRDYRQVATAFMEKHLKYKLDDFGLEMNAILDLQAGHTSRTASTSYAVSSEDHRSVSREAMHQFYLASKAWHELLQKEMKSETRKGILILFYMELII